MADLMQHSREQFEAWATEQGWDLSADGLYSNPDVQRCWETWQAAQRTVPEGFVMVPADSVLPCGCGCRRVCCRYCGAELGGFDAARPPEVSDDY